MKILGNINDVMSLDHQLASFILAVSPWMNEFADFSALAMVFLLTDDDIELVESVCALPQDLCCNDDDYKAAMTIDLASFDLWEPPEYDSVTGYWSLVAVFGQEYGCSLFLSSGFVASVPTLQARLQKMKSEKQ